LLRAKHPHSSRTAAASRGRPPQQTVLRIFDKQGCATTSNSRCGRHLIACRGYCVILAGLQSKQKNINELR